MTSTRHAYLSPHAALVAWLIHGFTLRAVVELPTYRTVYAWGEVDGVERLVVFSACYVSVSDDRGCPLQRVAGRPLSAHHAMRPGTDDE